MIPTIDFGSIAAIGAILTFLGKIWGYFVKARDFLLQHIALVVLGSKIWATAFFVGIIVSVLAIQNRIISTVSGKIAHWTWGAITRKGDMAFERAVLDQCFPFDDMISVITYGALSYASYLVFVTHLAFFKRCFGYFLGVVSAWKT